MFFFYVYNIARDDIFSRHTIDNESQGPSTKERMIDKGNCLPQGGLFIISMTRLTVTFTATGTLTTAATNYTVPTREERRNGRTQALYGLVNRTNAGENRRRSQASEQAIRAHTHTRTRARAQPQW